MFSKIIVVLATVCVINASVLTVNVFDDDPETQDASDPKDCNFQECDQLCRRLKFPGGACVNGRCKCDNSLNAEDETENTLSYLEDTVLQKDDPETEVKANPSKCNLKVCDKVCRWLNKAGGSCVDGRCKCAKSSNRKDDPETEVENKKSDCNNQVCDQLCRNLKLPGGICVNGRCKCDKFVNTEESLSNPEESVSPRACNNQKCYNLCRIIKMRGGACINGKCTCNKYISEQEDDMTDPGEFLPRGCNSRACDQQCLRLGRPGGACINGLCKCGNILNTEDSMTDSVESVPLSTCNSIACDDQCRRTGWHSGVCVKGQCKCDYFLNTEDAVTGNTLSNLEDSISPRRCTYEACNELCRKHKFPGGTCVNSRCKCDNFFGTKDAVDEYSEFAPRRRCRFTKCNRRCTHRGYANAKCVNARCKCYNIREEKDEISETSLPVSVLSEDNFFGTEDAVDEYSELATRPICNLKECTQTCKCRGYKGARCRVNGLCKCFYF